MFWLKACPRCKGDLYLDIGSRGKDIVCLQCGYRRYILTPGGHRTVRGYRYTQRMPRYREQVKDRVLVTL